MSPVMCTPTKVDSWSLQSSRIAGFTPPWQIKLSHKAKGYPPISRQHLPTRSPRSPSQVIRGLLACQKTTSHKQQTGQVAHLHQGLSLNLTVALLEIYNTRCFMTFSYHKSMDWKRMDDTHTHIATNQLIRGCMMGSADSFFGVCGGKKIV